MGLFTVKLRFGDKFLIFYSLYCALLFVITLQPSAYNCFMYRLAQAVI